MSNNPYHFVDGDKYYLFKNVFNVNNAPLLAAFEKLAFEDEHYFIEMSAKVDNEKLYANRFGLYFGDRLQFGRKLQQILTFFHKIEKEYGIQFDFSTYNTLLSLGLDFEKHCKVLILGIDFREDNIQKSRVKLWTILNQKGDMIKKKIFEYGNLSQAPIDDLIISHTELFGMDFHFDGSFRLKTYTQMTSEDLESEELKARYSEQEWKLIQYSEWFFTDIFDRNRLHLYLDKRLIPKIITHPITAHLYNKSHYMITLLPSEIQQSSISRFNIYF